MIKINFFKIKKEHYQYLEKLLKGTPVITRKKSKILKIDDQLRSVIGKLILKKMLIDAGYSKNVLKEIKLDKYNRPYINKTIDFNISHSGKYVLCTTSQSVRVGIDIEKIKPVKIDNFNILLSKKELKKTQNANEPLITFFDLLTKKEAVSKANGKGLGILFPHIKVKKKSAVCENVKWKLKNLDINKKYCAHIAFNKNCKIDLEELKMEDLLKI